MLKSRKMSIILHLGFLRCGARRSVSNLRRNFGTVSSLNAPFPGKILGPATEYSPIEEKPNHMLNVPEQYRLIYRFDGYGFIHFTSFATIVLSGSIIYAIREIMGKDESVTNDGESSVRTTTNPTDSTPSGNQEGDFLQVIVDYCYKMMENFSSDQRLSLVTAFVLLLFFLSVRANIVLCSYRNGNEYITLLSRFFGFGSKIVPHLKEEVIYYPNRWVSKYELCGKKVLFFNDCFASEDERLFLCSQNSHAEENFRLQE